MVAFAIAAVALQAASLRQQKLAANEQNKAQRQARDVDRRMASIENQRNKRRAIAQQRVQEAELIASAAADNTQGSSAVQGGVVSGQANLASSIGFQNTQLAANAARTSVLQRGADQAAAFQQQAGFLNLGASAFGMAHQRFGQPQATPST